jgi:hypothetical protein
LLLIEVGETGTEALFVGNYRETRYDAVNHMNR